MQHDARVKRFTHACEHCPPCNGRFAQRNGVFTAQWRFCYAMAFLLRNGVFATQWLWDYRFKRDALARDGAVVGFLKRGGV